MKSEALFLNGVYKSVLEEIMAVQGQLPEHIMFLQPYSSSAIARLRDDTPTVDDPMLLLISITDELSMVSYAAEIVGWNDKIDLPGKPAHDVLSRLIWTLQPKEGGLYNESKTEGGQSVNLLHIRRLRRVGEPFSVTKLTKSESGAVSNGRTTAGGWVYVNTDGVDKPGHSR